MFAVTFANQDGIDTYSRCFQSLQKARNWVKSLGSHPHVFINPRIMQGGVGGMEVK